LLIKMYSSLHSGLLTTPRRLILATARSSGFRIHFRLSPTRPCLGKALHKVCAFKVGYLLFCACKVTPLCTDGGTQISSDAVGTNHIRHRHIHGLCCVLVRCCRGCTVGLVVGIDGLVGRGRGLLETRMQLGDSLEVGGRMMLPLVSLHALMHALCI
jgi:hypothetical protein